MYSSPGKVQRVILRLLHKGTKDGGGPQIDVDAISLFLPQNRIGPLSSPALLNVFSAHCLLRHTGLSIIMLGASI